MHTYMHAFVMDGLFKQSYGNTNSREESKTSDTMDYPRIRDTIIVYRGVGTRGAPGTPVYIF